MKIYTKKGDNGTTYLFGGGPYPKDSERIRAYGEIDELNSVLGCVISEISIPSTKAKLQGVQEELFMLGAELATLTPTEKMKEGFIQEKHISFQEKWIDEIEIDLAPLQKFVLPGGSKPSSLLHLARTVCRRAERSVVSLSHDQPIRPEVIQYLNRLSDLFFVLARWMNHQLKVADILWEGILK
ncbi:MAG: cob(I)yrinic acid a,c-diamide adenosyltransferase [Deltaproteobacteria bacterium]|nr:cob(I)yrinic acid a,c-diamide adenosyltransferase [Deltaproteobacteria bacterium]